MNNYIIKQKDIEVLMQADKTLYYKLELLNKDFKVLDYIEGNLISDQISISADSDVRRTYSCELLVTDSTIDVGHGKKIFFNRFIKPYIGIKHQRSGEIIWYDIGIFVFIDTNYSYSDTTKTLSLTCNDMMCLLNGICGGNLDSYTRTIKAKTDARTVIIDLLKDAGITKYFIEFNINGNILNTFQIPYDMVYNAGVTIYQIIKDIVDLYPGTEFYFSKDGVCMIDRIPTSNNEQVVLNDEIIQPILIDEQLNTSFKDIYNHIEIWGKVNEPDYYTQAVTSSNGVYYASIVTSKLDEDTGEYAEVIYEEYDNFDTFALRIPETNKENQQININNLGNFPIVDDEGNPIKPNYLTANRDNIFRYREESSDFLFVGEYQIFNNVYLTNNKDNIDENAVVDINSEYAIEIIGDKLKVLSGGDYDKIPTSGLCRDRCKLELYNSTNKMESLSLTTLAICWLDVNQLIEFTSNSTNKKNKYLIDNISCNFAEHTMNISAHKFFAEYI